MANSLSELFVCVACLAVARAPAQAIVIKPEALHALNRITFGPTLPLLASLSLTPTSGPGPIDNYIDQQLALSGVEDPRVPLLLAQLPAVPTTIEDLKREEFIRACFSTYQLREVMTQFWERHFSTFYLGLIGIVQSFGGTQADAVGIVAAANQRFRANALGKFEDLLLANVDSKAMILYLSLWASQSAPNPPPPAPNLAPNEDLAREILELHTLGPEENGVANYSHDDIEAFAECLAGWNVYRSGLAGFTLLQPNSTAVLSSPALLDRCFVADWHENNLPLFFQFNPNITTDNLSLTTSSASDIDARLVIAHLARMRQTKAFICRKLIRFFLADAAVEPALLSQCVAAWGSNGGDIAAVLSVILKSAAFQGATYRWQRLRMPMEYTCWVVRALDGTATTPSNVDGLIAASDSMGQELHSYQTPEGFPTQSLRQPGSQIYLDAAKHALTRTATPAPGIMIHDLPGMVINGIGTLIPGGNPDDPTHVANYFLRRLYVGNWTPDDLTRCRDLVAATILGTPAPLDHVNAPVDYAQRINLLAALVLSLPQALKK